MRSSLPSLVAAALTLPSAALAQQTFRDSAKFLAALDPGTTITQGFEDAKFATIIPDSSEFGGLTWYFSLTGPAEGGIIGNFYNYIDTQGLMVERDGEEGPTAGDYFYSGEYVTFTFPEPVQAVGVFINVSGFDVPDYVVLNTSQGSAYSGGLVSEETVYPGFYFVGLVSDGPISKAQFGISDAVSAGWNADNLIYGNAAGGDDCYPDFDGDGGLTLFDFLAYVNAFNAGADDAECDNDPGLTLFDFLCYVNAFNAGC